MSRVWNFIQRVGIVAAFFIFIQVPPVAVEIANRYPHSELIVAGMMALFIVLMIAVIILARQTYRRYNQLGRPRGIRLGTVLLGYLVILFVEGLLGNLNQLVYHQSETANDANLAMMLGHNQLITLVFSFSAVVLSPIAEEYIFRGILTNIFFKADSFWPKVILSGIVFSCGHLSTNPISFAMYAMMGMVMAFVYRRTGDIRNSMILHGINNLVAMMILLGQV